MPAEVFSRVTGFPEQRSQWPADHGTEAVHVRVGVGHGAVRLHVVAVAADHAAAAHDPVGHGPRVGRAPAPLGHRLFDDVARGVGREHPVAQRVRLGARHHVIHELVARDRRAYGPAAVLHRRARGSVHLSADRHRAVVQHGTAELPEHHQLHRELGEPGALTQVHALERRAVQALLQVDVHHVQPAVAVRAPQAGQAGRQRHLFGTPRHV